MYSDLKGLSLCSCPNLYFLISATAWVGSLAFTSFRTRQDGDRKNYFHFSLLPRSHKKRETVENFEFLGEFHRIIKKAHVESRLG